MIHGATIEYWKLSILRWRSGIGLTTDNKSQFMNTQLPVKGTFFGRIMIDCSIIDGRFSDNASQS
jgi:hypothetical protein